MIGVGVALLRMWRRVDVADCAIWLCKLGMRGEAGVICVGKGWWSWFWRFENRV